MNFIRRRLAGAYPLTAAADSEAGVAVPISAPVMFTIFDAAGAVICTMTPTIEADGTLSVAVPYDDLPLLDAYHAVWTGTAGGAEQSWTTDFALAGAHIMEIADIRAYDAAFADPVKFSDAYLCRCRDQIEEQLEENGMCAFRPRGAREKLSGSGTRKLVLGNTDLRAVNSIVVDGVALTDTVLAAVTFAGNVIHRDEPWPRGFANIRVHYEYGYDSAPGPVRRAALILAKEYIVPSALPARATASTIGEMQYRITIAGRDGFTGIPDVDAAINQFGRVRPVVG